MTSIYSSVEKTALCTLSCISCSFELCCWVKMGAWSGESGSSINYGDAYMSIRLHGRSCSATCQSHELYSGCFYGVLMKTCGFGAIATWEHPGRKELFANLHQLSSWHVPLNLFVCFHFLFPFFCVCFLWTFIITRIGESTSWPCLFCMKAGWRSEPQRSLCGLF